jgi:peptidoglycan-N-acetylmuramic acid deacetylase
MYYEPKEEVYLDTQMGNSAKLHHGATRAIFAVKLFVLFLFLTCCSKVGTEAIAIQPDAEIFPTPSEVIPSASTYSSSLNLAQNQTDIPLQKSTAPEDRPTVGPTGVMPSPAYPQDPPPGPTPGLLQNSSLNQTPSLSQDSSLNQTPDLLQNPSVTPGANAAPEPANEANENRTRELIYPINSFQHATAMCLTFDDGGNKKAIEKTLEVLEQHDIKCTFFVIGKYLKSNAELWKKALEQGHQICNHSQNHKWLSDLSTEDMKKEILEWENSATDVLGEEYVKKMKAEFPYLRLPGGAGAKSKRVMGVLSELGYTPIGWSVESYYAVLRHHDLKKDSLSSIAQDVTEHIVKKARGGSIILLHFNPYDTHNLEDIISGIRNKGLTIELLSEQGL